MLNQIVQKDGRMAALVDSRLLVRAAPDQPAEGEYAVYADYGAVRSASSLRPVCLGLVGGAAITLAYLVMFLPQFINSPMQVSVYHEEA